ncbi:MAG TPA: hypothetical protein VKY74_06055 [Chloroflexia bacterium]|nr:hypothetical protein [Chloroflexia bacterium]
MNQTLTARRGLLAALAGLGLLGLLGLAASAATTPPSAATLAGPGPQLASLTLSAIPQNTGAPRTSFSTSADNAIYVQMVWTHLSGMHDAYLHITGADGALYQVLDVPFTTQAGPAGAAAVTRAQPGALHPVSVQVAPATAGGNAVWGAVPIAGSWMVRLPGRWHLDVTLDGGQSVYGSVKWTLTP